MRKPVTRWGRNLKRLIRERGLNQGEVAIQAGLNRNGISRIYPAADVKVSSLEALAKAIGVDVAAFFDPVVDRDLIRHGVLSGSALSEGGADAATAQTRVLARHLERNRALARQVRDAIVQLTDIATDLEKEAGAASARRASRADRDRKTS